MGLDLATSICELLSLSTETFLRLLAPLTLPSISGPPQRPLPCPALPPLASSAWEGAWHPTKRLWADPEPSSEPLAHPCCSQPERHCRVGPSRAAVASHGAYGAPEEDLLFRPLPAVAGTLCQALSAAHWAGTRANPSLLPTSPEAFSSMNKWWKVALEAKLLCTTSGGAVRS